MRDNVTDQPPDATDKKNVTSQQTIQVQSMYFNGFQNTLGQSDISSLLLLDGIPVVELKMSFTTAKTFAKLLAEVVSELEKAVERNIMTSQQIIEGLKEIQNPQSKAED